MTKEESMSLIDKALKKKEEESQLIDEGLKLLLNRMRILSCRLEDIMYRIHPKNGKSYNISANSETDIEENVTMVCRITSQEISLKIIIDSKSLRKESNIEWHSSFGNIILSSYYDRCMDIVGISLSLDSGSIFLPNPIRPITDVYTKFIYQHGESKSIKFSLNEVNFMNEIMEQVMANYAIYFADIISKDIFNNN